MIRRGACPAGDTRASDGKEERLSSSPQRPIRAPTAASQALLRDTSRDVADTYRSGDALFAFDAELTVVAWNDAAERLTGISADAAHRAAVLGCPARRERAGRPDLPSGLLQRSPRSRGLARSRARGCSSRRRRGRKLVSVSTIAVHRKGEEPVALNLLRNGYAIEPTKRAAQRLTARQIDVLQLLAAGEQVKTIAGHLGIAEPTARNHVAGILRRLGCHSQLEAVAEARRLELDLTRRSVRRARCGAACPRSSSLGAVRSSQTTPPRQTAVAARSPTKPSV